MSTVWRTHSSSIFLEKSNFLMNFLLLDIQLIEKQHDSAMAAEIDGTSKGLLGTK